MEKYRNTMRAAKRQPPRLRKILVLRYGDTSPYRCWLLKENDGYYTVLCENGKVICDLAGWFVPFREGLKKGGLHYENE